MIYRSGDASDLVQHIRIYARKSSAPLYVRIVEEPPLLSDQGCDSAAHPAHPRVDPFEVATRAQEINHTAWITER